MTFETKSIARSACFRLVCVFFSLALAGLTLADELHFTNGSVVSGTYVGGDARSVRFMDSAGNLQTYPVGERL